MKLFVTTPCSPKKLILILLIILYLGITIIQIVNIFITPPEYYIYDIYGHYPVFYWALILFLVGICGFLLIHFSLSKNNYGKLTTLVIFGLFLIMCALYLQNISLFFFTGRGDPLSHIGYVNDILLHGSWGEANIYPATHILISSLVLLLDCPPINVTKYLPLLSFSMYFLLMYCVGRIVFRDNRLLYYFVGLSSLPIFGFAQAQFWPNMFLIFSIPLILYVVLRCRTKNSNEFYILLIFLLLFISFGHPLTSFILTMLFFINIIYFQTHLKRRDFKFLLVIVSGFLILALLFYYLNFAESEMHQQIFLHIYDFMLSGNEQESGELITNLGRISSDTSLFKVIRVAVFHYGTYVILGAISALIFAYIGISTIKNKEKFSNILVSVSICSFFAYGFAFINLIILDLDVHRIYNVGHVFTIILIPLFMTHLKKSNNGRKNILLNKGRKNIFPLISLTMVILFFILAIISIFSVHPSPYFTSRGNEQVTESEYFAMKTFHNYKEDLPFVEFHARTARFYHAIYGMNKAIDDNMRSYVDRLPQENLGYDQFNTFAQGHGSNIYFIDPRLTYYSKHNSEMFEKYLIDRKIFSKLENDMTANRIFSNSYTNIYLIK